MSANVYTLALAAKRLWQSTRAPLKIQRAQYAAGTAAEHMGVDLGGGEVLVTKQFLDRANVMPRLEQATIRRT